MASAKTEAKRSLEDFFERWIYDFDLPTLRFDYHTEARLSGQQGETDVILRFEQEGIPFEIPVTATLRYQRLCRTQLSARNIAAITVI